MRFLRFLPYKETGEFVNVGVIVHYPEINLFDFKLAATTNRRVRQFFPELDASVYRAALRTMEIELNSYRNMDEFSVPARIVSQSEISHGLATFRTLLQRREALLHFAAPGTLLGDPRAAMTELFDRYIERQFARDPSYHESVMRRQLNQWLKQWGLRDQYETDAVIGDPMFHLKFPFVRKISSTAVRAVKPLDLVRQEPTKVYEHGDLWVQRMRRLEERQCLPTQMIFPVRLPTEENATTAARAVLHDLVKIPNVIWLPFDDQDQRLRQALAG